MQLTLVFHLFLARTAAGTLLALLPLWRMRAAERHVRFQGLLALVLLGLALVIRPPGVERGDVAMAGLSVAGAGTYALWGCVLACLLSNVGYGTFRRRLGRLALVLGCGLGVVGSLVLTPVASGGAVLSGPHLLRAGSGLLGGLFMASLVNAMILGHFYLVIRGLPLAALKRAGILVAIVLGARIALLGLALAFLPGAAEVLLGSELVWTLWRISFGFVGPLVLLFLVKDTVRLRHTQAATGLLYVAVAFGLMGELAAVWLEVHTGLPV